MIFIACLLYGVFFFFGWQFFSKNYGLLKQSWQARKWPQVNGKITAFAHEGKWQAIESNVDGYKKIQLAYEYQYKMNHYRGETLTFDGNFVHSQMKSETGHRIKDINKFHKLLNQDNEIQVWVNPKHPTESIILNKFHKYLPKVLMGITFMTWGIGSAILLTGIIQIPLADKITVHELLSDYEKEHFFPCEGSENLYQIIYRAVNTMQMTGKFENISQESRISSVSNDVNISRDSLTYYVTTDVTLFQSDEKFTTEIKFILLKSECDFMVLEKEIIGGTKKLENNH